MTRRGNAPYWALPSHRRRHGDIFVGLGGAFWGGTVSSRPGGHGRTRGWV